MLLQHTILNVQGSIPIICCRDLCTNSTTQQYTNHTTTQPHNHTTTLTTDGVQKRGGQRQDKPQQGAPFAVPIEMHVSSSPPPTIPTPAPAAALPPQFQHKARQIDGTKTNQKTTRHNGQQQVQITDQDHQLGQEPGQDNRTHGFLRKEKRKKVACA